MGNMNIHIIYLVNSRENWALKICDVDHRRGRPTVATTCINLSMACIATWSFGVEAVLAAAKEIEREQNCLDAVERSVNGEWMMSFNC